MRQSVVDPFDPKPVQPGGTNREVRQFSALAGVILVAIAGVPLWRGGSPRVGLAWVGAGLLITCIGMLAPKVMRPVFLSLMAIATPIGHLVSKLVLALVYLAVFTPVAMVFKLMKRDALRLKRPPKDASCWRPCPHVGDLGQYLKQF